MHRYDGFRAAVVGGSIGGLFSALLLRELGFTVDVFERTPEQLDHRGGGIVLQPITMKWFDEHSGRRIEELSTHEQRAALPRSGRRRRVRGTRPRGATRRGAPCTGRCSAISVDEHYHLGEFCAGLTQDADRVELRFVTGRVERADLVVFADGISSTGRRRLFPDLERRYSGYVGWRGTVREDRVARRTHALLADALSTASDTAPTRVTYLIPGMDGELEPGRRLFNVRLVPQRRRRPGTGRAHHRRARPRVPGLAVPPGAVQERYVEEMREAAATQLAPAVAEVITRTARPYLQVVFDTRIPGMAQGRVAVIGDAAFAARPHAAAGTAKAAADAWALYEHLGAAGGDIADALKRWEPGQLELGNRLVDRVAAMGGRSQFDGTWVPG